jgi:hypothetical protein
MGRACRKKYVRRRKQVVKPEGKTTGKAKT